MSTKNKLKFGALALICVCLIVYAVSWIPQKISLEHPYVEYHENDETHVVYGTIRIEGKMQRPLFNYPIFTGEFDIDNYEPIQKYDQGQQLPPMPHFSDTGRAMLFYQEPFYERMKYFGYMTVFKNFDELMINVTEYPRGNLKDADYYGLILAAPATTLDEAKSIAEKYPHMIPREPIIVK